MTIALTLFDLTDLNPTTTGTHPCARCGDRPATTQTHTATNFYGTTAPYLAPTRYRNLAPVHSAPCCSPCAWTLAEAWWGASFVCPSGTCHLWAHTATDPLPGADCTRCHRETNVVWRSAWEVAS